jgi:CAAX protease family protein
MIVDASNRAARFEWIGWSVGVACALAGALAAARLAVQQGYGGAPLAAAIAALFLLLLPYFLLGLTALPSSLGEWMEARRGRVLLVVALPVLHYLAYASGTRTFSWIALLKLVVFVLVPLVLLVSARRSGPPPRVQDALAVLAIWLPLEFGWLRDVWRWEAGLGAYMLSEILGVDVAVILFVSMRKLAGVGFSLVPRRADLPVAAWNLLIFSCIAIPIGLWTHFIVPVHGSADLLGIPGRFVAILLLIALPEELLFRGLIQNLLEKALPATYALLLAALIFGASHLNNGPSPDWRYFLLASVAGVFYGLAYRRSGGLMAACLLHAAVDTIWREFFR